MTKQRILAVLATVVALAAGTSCSDSSADVPLAADPDSQVATTGDGAEGASDDGSDGDKGGEGAAPDDGGTQQESKPVPVKKFVSLMKRGNEGVSTAHIWMRVGGLQPMITTGDMRFDDDNPAMDMTIESPQLGGKSRLILLDGVVYFGLPDLPRGTFVAADPDDPRDRLGRVASGFISELDIQSSYDAFDDALRRVVHLGSEVVNGQPVDHYRIVIDAKESLRSQGERVPAGMPGTFTADLWFDKQGRTTKMSMDMDGVTLVTTMSAYNEPVSITAPPASKIVRLP